MFRPTLSALFLLLACLVTARADPLAFDRVTIDTGGEQARACLRFNARLDPRIEAHYADWLRLSPAATPDVHAEGNDLCLSGLAFGQSYQVTILAGLTSADGLRLADDRTVRFTLADRNPLIAISGNGFILSRQTATGLAIDTVNIDRLRLHVLRMSPSMLASNASLLTDPGAVQWGYSLRDTVRNQATLIWSGTMDVRRDRNRTVRTAFPIDQVIKGRPPGAYLVLAESAAKPPNALFSTAEQDSDTYPEIQGADQYIAAHWLISTDLALTTFSGPDGLHVFVRSLATALPAAGVKVSLISIGLDTLSAVTTGPDGQAAFAPGLLRGHGASRARTMTALSPAGDFTTASLDRPAFDLSDRGVSGRPAATGPAQAFLATDRGVYRPGETVNVVSLLRDRLGRALSAPLTLILRRPDGVEARRADIPAGQAGGAVHAFTLTQTAALGHWSIDARLDPTEPPVGSVGFAVQDFVPQQLAVHLAGLPARVTPGQPLAFTLDGRFLYGAPAAGLHGEAHLAIARDDAPVPDAPRGYVFGIADERVDTDEQQLDVPDADQAGHADARAPFKIPATVSVPLQATLTAGLVEPSGRLVADTAQFHIRNQATLIGVRARIPAGFSEQTQASFDVLAWDADAHPLAIPALQWSIIRENQVFDWFSTNGGWSFHYHTVDEPIANGRLDVAAGSAATLTHALDWGHYRFVATDPRTGVSSSTTFDIGWSEASTEADTPDKIEVTAPTTRLAIGQTVKLHVRGFFAGHAQIVIANDRVLETRELDLPAGGADIPVTATKDWGAGAYVLVSLYRPLDRPAPHAPVRAVGLAWLATDETAHTLSVSFQAPTIVLPRATTTVPIHVAGATGPTFVTLAAVDEGILQLTNYPTPDPAGFLFGKRRLALDMHDDYGRLLDADAPRGAIREGGDEGFGRGLPVTSTRIVSLFSGPVQLDASGNARIPLAIPDFEGELRLVAIAWNDQAVGAGAAPLTVRDPVFAQLDLPRFLAPNDTAQAALGLVDEDRPGPYHLTVSATGPVTIGAHTVDAILAAGTRREYALALTATDIGVATLATDLTGPGAFHQRRTWQIAVRPAHLPVTLTDTEAQDPGQTFRVDPRQLATFLPGGLSVTVGYAGTRGLDPSSLLQSLERYPFGCTEQLASTAWPLLYFNDPGLLGRLPGDRSATARVQTAIDTIVDREDPAGRFGLWRVGDGEASPWLDAYATDFLMHARDAGFDVPGEALDRALGRIADEVNFIDPYQNRYASDADNSRAYGWYVLTRAGRPDLAAMRRAQQSLAATGAYPTAVSWPDGNVPAGPLSLAHLAGALALMGEHERAHQTFALARANLGVLDNGSLWPSGWFDWSYFSYRRDLAAVTAIAADSGEDELAQSLIDQFGRPDWNDRFLTTQESAALLSAAHAMNRDEPGRAITAGGHRVDPLRLPATFAPTLDQVRAGYDLVNTGTKPLWRTFTVTGAPRDALPSLEAGYHLDRQTFTLDGKPLDAAHLRQNDRFVVVLHGTADDNADHRTVLIDPLPAGWEIETPIRKPEQAPFVGILSSTRVIQARDDRFIAAFDLGQGLREQDLVVDDNAPSPLGLEEFRVAYIVRVVTPGHFTRPEAVVTDMYRPQLTARTDQGETTADPR